MNGDNLPLPCLQEGITTKDALNLFDEEVLKHQKHILKLKNCRNTYTTLFRLPPEIIIKVFELVKQYEPLSKWIKITHVCRSLRDIMLDTPSFWTTLPLGYPDFTAAMITRSKSADLTVRIDFCQSLRPIQRSTALSTIRLMPRIKNLAIEGYENHKVIMQKILDDLPKAAPVLESLVINLDDYYYYEKSGPIRLPDQALCNMERLRRLEAIYCRINWDTHIYNKPYLRYLKLRDVMHSERPTASQFWNALREMPTLEFLFLADILPDSNTVPDTIHLPNLQCLVLDAKSDQVALFLETVKFPATIPVELICRGNEIPACLRVLRALSSTILSGSADGTEIHTLQFSRSSNANDLVLDAHYAPLSKEIPYEVHGHTVNSNLRTSFSIETNLTTAILWEAIFLHLPLTNVRTFLLKLWKATITPTKIAASLGKLPHLKSIDLDSCDEIARQIVAALQKPSFTDPNSPSFPSLAEITMRRIHFTGEQDDNFVFTFETLLDCLIWRYECGVEVEKLTISYCTGLESDSIARLQEIVTNVKLDGSYFDDDFDAEYGYDDFEDYGYDDYEDDGDSYNHNWDSDFSHGSRFYEDEYSDPGFSVFD